MVSACTHLDKEVVTLPVLKIERSEPMSWTNKLPCTIDYITETDSLHFKAKIKHRGGVSSQYPKSSFTFKLDRDWAPTGLKPDNDWILNAAFVDKTHMRHQLSYLLFNEMDSTNIAPEVNYVEVYYNEEYRGLYQLTERMDSKRLGIDKMDHLAAFFKGPPIFYKEDISYVQDSLNYYHQKYPKSRKRDLTSQMDSLRSFLFNSSDSLFQADIGKHFDLNNILNWQLILMLSNNSDGIMKNFYLYKQNANTPFRIAIWDYDHSFGRDGDYQYNMMERNINPKINVLFCRLMSLNIDFYREKLVEKWFFLRENNIFTEENIAGHMVEMHRNIELYIDKDLQRWPKDEWFKDKTDYSEELEIIKKYTNLRLNYLDSFFEVLLQEEIECTDPWPKA